MDKEKDQEKKKELIKKMEEEKKQSQLVDALELMTGNNFPKHLRKRKHF